MEDHTITAYVLATAHRLGRVVTREQAAEPFLDAIWLRFAGKKRTPYQFTLWDYVTDRVCVYSPEAWSWVGEYIGHKPTIMIIDDYEGVQTVLRFPNGADVVPVLEEEPPFVFYLTNDAMDYLLFYNDHDALGAAGDAKEWLRARP